MLLTIYILTILLCIYNYQNKNFFWIMVFILWLISGFCYENADTEIYSYRYYQFEHVSSLSEVGFTYLMKLFNNMNVSFNVFLKIIYAFIFCVVAWFINKNSRYPNIAIALYAIFPFCIDVVQLRSTLAFSFVLIGIDSLLNEEDNILTYLKYIFCVFLAMSIHASSILFLALVIAKKYSIKHTLLIYTILCLLVSLILNEKLLYYVGEQLISTDRITMILKAATMFPFTIKIKVMIMVICTALVCVMVLLSVKKSLTEKFDIEKVDCIIKSQFIILITLPLLIYTLGFYRIGRYMVLVAYIGFTYNLMENSYKNTCFFNTILGMIVCCLFYVQIVMMGNFDSTFKSLFLNNSIRVLFGM